MELPRRQFFKSAWLRYFITGLVSFILFPGCRQGSQIDSGESLFVLKSPQETGIHFSNDLKEDHKNNVLIYQDYYSGGGVSIGDINNDGFSDIFFTGNMVPSRLYINKGNFAFEDVTSKAGLLDMGNGWYTGTTMTDINHDGFLDIYICKSGMFGPEDRRNLLFMNNRDGTFSEKADEYNLDHPGYAVNSTFFDYDNDGDLDMYLVNQGPEKFNSGEIEKLRMENHPYCGDNLFENTDNGYIDVTDSTGIYSSAIGFGHGVAAGDLNDDGWEDIFISNDFFEHDYLYFNNRNKTFRETITTSTKHISNFSMGNDLADFNNDGLLDIMVVDMVAEDNRRLHENLGGMSMNKFWTNVSGGFHYQYMYNMLHLNNGNETFSEIGQLAGVSNTDWSWGPLWADFDSDGLKDLYITNGIRKDMRNIDWIVIYREVMKKSFNKVEFRENEWDLLLTSMPSEKIENYMYRNNGDLTFSKMMDEWGTGMPSFSNGSAYGDLDNDGDLDLVVNNVNDPAFVFENRRNEKEGYHFLKIRLKGPEKNNLGLGTKLRIYHNGHFQYQQFYLTRGYRSSVDPYVFFGLGRDSLVDKINITWPGGRTTTLENVKSNQFLEVDYKDSSAPEVTESKETGIYFEDFTEESGIKINHIENEFDDFAKQLLLPYKLSTLGPGMAVADVNGDGREDLFVGGAFRHAGHLFMQNRNGTFRESGPEPWLTDRLYENTGAVFFDAEGDGDQDLYLVCGGNEFPPDYPSYQDRLYLNDGAGNFAHSNDALPENTTSGSIAIPCDYDLDGDTDMFVGGRLFPWKYPYPVSSSLLENSNGKFADVTSRAAPGLINIGMVTAAVWSDYDLDKDMDLIIAGEWMPITVFRNDKGIFTREQSANGLENTEGWWWSIDSYDFDQDGDEDYFAGNLGLNIKYKASVNEPFEIYASDFDSSGNIDIALGWHYEHKLYPVRNRAASFGQVPDMKNRIPTNEKFSVMTLPEIYGMSVLNTSLHYSARTFASSYIENTGQGKFKIHPLDNQAQLSNLNSILIADVDSDGMKEIIMAGNLYSLEIETIRIDAGNGILLKNNGGGDFKIIPGNQCGLFADGDIRNARLINTAKGRLLVFARNNDSVKVIKIRENTPILPSR